MDPAIPFFFKLLVNSAFYCALAFFALCLACGFYYIAELSEEYTVLTRKILRASVFVVWVVYFILWIVDGFPLMYCLIGVIAHAAYFSMLKNFPFVHLQSLPLLSSVVGFVATHIAWYMYFIDPYTPMYQYGHLLGFFFVCIWLVPFGFFITVTVDDLALPGSGGIDSASGDLGFGSKRPKITHHVVALAGKLKTAVFGKDPFAQPIAHKAS